MAQPFIFISYSHKDEADKDSLLTHLKGLQLAKRITLWSDDQIGAGTDWQGAITGAIAQANIALLLVTANYLASDFITQEEIPALLARQAKDGLRIIPVIARPCAWQEIPWLAAMEVRPKGRQPVWRDGGLYVDHELAVIAAEISGAVQIHNLPELPVSPTSTEANQELIPECPYRGLFAFRPEHAPFFFGRELFTQKLVQAAISRNLVTVVGASGSGKSSVVFAGLAPLLLSQTFEPWLFTTFRPGDDPFFGLASALVPLLDPALSKIKQISEARDLATRLGDGRARLPDYLNTIHQAYPDHRLLLIIDFYVLRFTATPSPPTATPASAG